MAGMTSVRNCILSQTRLNPGPFDTLDPFLFCVYHNDNYPAGNEKCEAPRRGNGMDFDPNADYRMYHGTKVPGFPSHPHRGFETLTATIDGIIDHADSLQNGGRYGWGDNQWMTAGKGIVHGEMFPLVNNDKPNPLRFFQIWLNLPSKDKMADPCYVMHWAEDIPKYTSPDELAKMTIFAGQFNDNDGKKLVSLQPPPNSWAMKPENEVGVYHITLQPGGTLTLPAAISGSKINRRAFFIEGTSLLINDEKGRAKNAITLDASIDARLKNDGATVTEVLVLQGNPIGEPVAQHGPFVMNTQQEIQEAFSDYRRTQFGGWPWPDDDQIFPRTTGRFSKQNNIEELPPSAGGGTC
jgi:quercetin 2,3-dioxygenase